VRPFEEASPQSAGKPAVKGPLLWASMSGGVTAAAVDPVQGLIAGIMTFLFAYGVVRYWAGRPTDGT
jgi:hypothetical protein